MRAGDPGIEYRFTQTGALHPGLIERTLPAMEEEDTTSSTKIFSASRNI